MPKPKTNFGQILLDEGKSVRSEPLFVARKERKKNAIGKGTL